MLDPPAQLAPIAAVLIVKNRSCSRWFYQRKPSFWLLKIGLKVWNRLNPYLWKHRLQYRDRL